MKPIFDEDASGNVLMSKPLGQAGKAASPQQHLLGAHICGFQVQIHIGGFSVVVSVEGDKFRIEAFQDGHTLSDMLREAAGLPDPAALNTGCTTTAILI